MKTTIVLFSCIYLSAFVQSDYGEQTSPSISKTVIFIKEWITGTEELQTLNLPSIIFFDDLNLPHVNEALNNLKHKIYDNNNNNGYIALSNEKSDESNDYEANVKNKNVTNDGNAKNTLTPSDKTETKELTCTEKNERYPIAGSCDGYMECVNGTAEKKLCPDGLRYNHNMTSNEPCQYPADVQCSPGATLQPPNGTILCPRRYGYFKIEGYSNCGNFRICENGFAYDYTCPENLAFNSETYRCDWPYRVPQCDAEKYLNFRCPAHGQQSNESVTPRSYRYSIDCNVYFTCIDKKPRRHECNKLFAFHEANQTCVPAFQVPECSESEKSAATRYIKLNENNEYVSINDLDAVYFYTRALSLEFSPIEKRPRPIS